jgi:molybdopterin converting factor small subunit
MSSPDRRAAGSRERQTGEGLAVTVRLLASYRQYLPLDHDEQAGYALQVAPGLLAGQLLDGLPMPAGERYTFFINGRHAERDQVLQEGDILTVFPAVGGG